MSNSFGQQVIDLYKVGASDAEVAAELKITIKNYYKQVADNPAFATLVDHGRTYSQAFWEGQARKNITNKGFNTPLWTFYMKNKYGWADKTEAVQSGDSTNQDLDAMRAQLLKETAKFLKEHQPELTDAQRVLKELQAEQDE